MGKPTGFMEYTRELPPKRPVQERVKDFKEINLPFPEEYQRKQAARCMDCGVPFCHTGCPLGNIVPDWNDLVYRGHWKRAMEVLHSTNNFPEFTGRICPAPCEEACVLGLTEPPVTIEQIEYSIIERAFREGWIQPEPPEKRTGKKVAVIGSGPSGLACAQQLNRAGHSVTVFERADRIGGLLRYGIPDFKLEKATIDRRLKILEAEGIVFQPGTDIGKNYPIEKLKEFDAVVLCTGSTKPRNLPIPGHELEGIHFAMDFLRQQNRLVAGDSLEDSLLPRISAEGKHVIVIGGGDTGSDCVGTSNRQGALSVTQIEILPMPPSSRPIHQPWPYWPMKLRTSTSHEEGCERYWSVSAKAFLGAEGKVQKIKTVEVDFQKNEETGAGRFVEIAGTEKEWPADLVLLALGFVSPETYGVVEEFGLEKDLRGNIKTDANYMTSVPGIFSAGDCRRGQSLVVWAISEGREAARGVDLYLMGHSDLPAKGGFDLPRP
jgi:glutamate synthase (NADPH/NADH) small chain